MRDRARVIRFTAPTELVFIIMVVVCVLEHGATVAISAASAELVQPSVPRILASPETVRGQIRARRLQIGLLGTRPMEPVEAQFV